MLRDVARCCEMLRYVAICCEMLRDVARCCEILRDVARCCEMLRDVARCSDSVKTSATTMMFGAIKCAIKCARTGVSPISQDIRSYIVILY